MISSTRICFCVFLCSLNYFCYVGASITSSLHFILVGGKKNLMSMPRFSCWIVDNDSHYHSSFTPSPRSASSLDYSAIGNQQYRKVFYYFFVLKSARFPMLLKCDILVALHTLCLLHFRSSRWLRLTSRSSSKTASGLQS